MFLKRKESYKLIRAIDELFDKRIEHQRIKKMANTSDQNRNWGEADEDGAIFRGEKEVHNLKTRYRAVEASNHAPMRYSAL